MSLQWFLYCNIWRVCQVFNVRRNIKSQHSWTDFSTKQASVLLSDPLNWHRLLWLKMRNKLEKNINTYLIPTDNNTQKILSIKIHWLKSCQVFMYTNYRLHFMTINCHVTWLTVHSNQHSNNRKTWNNFHNDWQTKQHMHSLNSLWKYYDHFSLEMHLNAETIS